jgi:putative addiction module component (TIGR02574 family)
MTVDQTIQTITNLPVADRLLIAEALWDSFADSDLPPLSVSQQDEIDTRMAAHELNPSTSLSREEVEVRLRELR